MELLKLNIGAGLTYIEGFQNIDISSQADINLDLSKEKLPFEDDSVDLVFSYHCIEHVEDYLFALGEIYRVLKHGGVFLLGTPYVTLTEYNLVNPYHLHHFNEYSFDFFEAGKLKGSAKESNGINFKKYFHQFHYMGIFNLLPPVLNTWCRRHLFNVVRKIDFGMVAIKTNDPIPGNVNAALLRREFRKCLAGRIRYDRVARSSPDSFMGILKTKAKRIRDRWNGDAD